METTGSLSGLHVYSIKINLITTKRPMKRYLKFPFIFYLVFFLLITACTVQKADPITTTQEQASVLTESYPAPIKSPPQVSDPGYPVPTPSIVFEETSGPLIIPTPGTGTGVVVGVVYDIEDKTALSNQTIFLGDVIHPTVGTGFSIGIDQAISPNTVTNQDGEFAIGGIKPGEYVIMAWTPFQSSVVLDPATNQPLVIIVEPNKTITLGDLKVTNPN